MQIVERKKEELQQTKAHTPLRKIQDKVNKEEEKKGADAFYRSIQEYQGTYLITEVKKCSPSHPEGFLKNFVHKDIAMAYIEAKAPALSVLTEKNFFGGSSETLTMIRPLTDALLLRKDFIIDPYQIWEAKKIGADIILLIAAILSEKELEEFSSLASSLGLSVLLEIHNKEEYEKVKSLKPAVLGVNNRNLKDFSLDLNRTAEIAQLIDFPCSLVSESGIRTREDILFLQKYGARAFLVGESLVKSGDIKGMIAHLRGE